MTFKNFEIVQSDNDDTTYELVKRNDFSCFVVAYLRWCGKESDWGLQSVGLRLIEHWVDGLDEYIQNWCYMATVCMEAKE